jgi:hypothetical protein
VIPSDAVVMCGRVVRVARWWVEGQGSNQQPEKGIQAWGNPFPSLSSNRIASIGTLVASIA